MTGYSLPKAEAYSLRSVIRVFREAANLIHHPQKLAHLGHMPIEYRQYSLTRSPFWPR
jgi:hypothetical protein